MKYWQRLSGKLLIPVGGQFTVGGSVVGIFVVTFVVSTGKSDTVGGVGIKGAVVVTVVGSGEGAVGGFWPSIIVTIESVNRSTQIENVLILAKLNQLTFIRKFNIKLI
jgi:hypothetical protein